MPTAKNTVALGRAVLLPLADDQIPGEFKLLSAGWNDTTKGVLLFDEAGAEATLADWKDYGNRLQIDYGHASLDEHPRDPKEAQKAAGSFVPVVRDGALFASDVRWTPPAVEALRNREFIYQSPVVGFDDERRVTAILGCALCGNPAIKHLDPIVPLSRGAKGQTMPHPRRKPLSQRIREVFAPDEREALDRRTEAALSKMSFDECGQAVRAAVAAKWPPPDDKPFDGPWMVELFDDAVIVELPDGKCLQLPWTMADGAVALGEPVEVRRVWEPVAKAEAPEAPEPPEAEEKPAEPEKPAADEKPADEKPADEKPEKPEAETAAASGDKPAESAALAREPEVPESVKLALARAQEAETAALAARSDALAAKAAADKRQADADQQVATLRRQERGRLARDRVAALKALPGVPLDTLAADMLVLEDAAPEQAKRIWLSLESAAAAARAIVAPPASKPGGEPVETDPVAETHKRAEALRKADPKLTVEQACAKVHLADPALYRAHKAATAPAIRAAKDADTDD